MQKQILKIGQRLLLGSLLGMAAISLQGCYEQTKEVKTDRALKSNCQMTSDAAMKCQAGKCQTGKCGDAKKAPAMKCQGGKCGEGK